MVSKVLSSMSSKYRLPQIGFSTTSASLGSHALYPNFFRTVPSDDVQIKVDVVIPIQSKPHYLEVNKMSQFFYGPATTHKDDHFAKITALKLEENTKVKISNHPFLFPFMS